MERIFIFIFYTNKDVREIDIFNATGRIDLSAVISMDILLIL